MTEPWSLESAAHERAEALWSSPLPHPWRPYIEDILVEFGREVQARTEERVRAETLADETTWRQLMWVRHGCPIADLYGDDGEMQCSCCHIDFKRDSVQAILDVFAVQGRAALREIAPKEQP